MISPKSSDNSEIHDSGNKKSEFILDNSNSCYSLRAIKRNLT